jgi:preprotein translocase subunit SecG
MNAGARPTFRKPRRADKDRKPVQHPLKKATTMQIAIWIIIILVIAALIKYLLKDDGKK